MSSGFRKGGATAQARFCGVLLVLVLSGCEREQRSYRADPVASETPEQIALTSISPGPTGPLEYRSGKGKEYEQNAFHLSQGKRLYTWFNCSGCQCAPSSNETKTPSSVPA